MSSSFLTSNQFVLNKVLKQLHFFLLEISRRENYREFQVSPLLQCFGKRLAGYLEILTNFSPLEYWLRVLCHGNVFLCNWKSVIVNMYYIYFCVLAHVIKAFMFRLRNRCDTISKQYVNIYFQHLKSKCKTKSNSVFK